MSTNKTLNTDEWVDDNGFINLHNAIYLFNFFNARNYVPEAIFYSGARNIIYKRGFQSRN